MDHKEFLKKHSFIPNDFIDEYTSMIPENSLPTHFVVSLEMMSNWLKSTKASLFRTLKESYKVKTDYIVIKSKKDSNQEKHGGSNHKNVLLTPDCFKRVCMLSKSPKAEQVRDYFIQIESLSVRYHQFVISGMAKEIKQLENQVKPKMLPKTGGYIYVIRASGDFDSVFKIGRTSNLHNRIKNYQSGKYENIEVLFQLRTDNAEAIEACIKLALNNQRFSKHKEIFKADINLIKEIACKCDDIENIKKFFEKSKASKTTGEYYLGVFKDETAGSAKKETKGSRSKESKKKVTGSSSKRVIK
jgi:phage anti-repressor protein